MSATSIPIYDRDHIQSTYSGMVKISNSLQGTVWRAMHSPSKTSVVIKQTDIQLHTDCIAVIDGATKHVHENVIDEQSILHCLTSSDRRCKSIVNFIDFFQCDNSYYFVMEDGGACSLLDYSLKAHEYILSGHLSIDEWQKIVKTIFIQMVNAIDYIHAKSICHFDISLENIIVAINGKQTLHGNIQNIVKCQYNPESVVVKLCDFGLATSMHKESKFKSKRFVGKSEYCSPEIANRKKPFDHFDARSNDIWCFGVCMFMLVTGGRPYEKPCKSDLGFNAVMNGKVRQMLRAWQRTKYVNDELMAVFNVVFQYEAKRATIDDLKELALFRM